MKKIFRIALVLLMSLVIFNYNVKALEETNIDNLEITNEVNDSETSNEEETVEEEVIEEEIEEETEPEETYETSNEEEAVEETEVEVSENIETAVEDETPVETNIEENSLMVKSLQATPKAFLDATVNTYITDGYGVTSLFRTTNYPVYATNYGYIYNNVSTLGITTADYIEVIIDGKYYEAKPLPETTPDYGTEGNPKFYYSVDDLTSIYFAGELFANAKNMNVNIYYVYIDQETDYNLDITYIFYTGSFEDAAVEEITDGVDKVVNEGKNQDLENGYAYITSTTTTYRADDYVFESYKYGTKPTVTIPNYGKGAWNIAIVIGYDNSYNDNVKGQVNDLEATVAIYGTMVHDNLHYYVFYVPIMCSATVDHIVENDPEDNNKLKEQEVLKAQGLNTKELSALTDLDETLEYSHMEITVDTLDSKGNVISTTKEVENEPASTYTYTFNRPISYGYTEDGEEYEFAPKVHITFVYTRYSTITAHYVDDTDKELHEDIIIRKKVGEEYKTEELDIEDYDIIRIDNEEQIEGVATKEPIEVTYVYGFAGGMGDGEEESLNPKTLDPIYELVISLALSLSTCGYAILKLIRK